MMENLARSFVYIGLFTPLLVSLNAFACPLCRTTTAEQVRAGLLTTSLDGLTIPGLILPFLVLAVIITAIQINWSDFLIIKNKIKPTTIIRKME